MAAHRSVVRCIALVALMDAAQSQCAIGLCGAGLFHWQGRCHRCEAGRYSPGCGQCDNCAAGRYSNQGASTCILCAAGQYSESAGTSSCTTCEAGQFAEQPGQRNCSTCSAGTYFPGTGSSSRVDCIDCSLGRYATAGSGSCSDCARGRYSVTSGAASCTACAAGTSSHDIGATSAAVCNKCDAGRFSSAGQSHCFACAVGTYSATAGATACLACDEGKSSNSIAAQSAASCVACAAGRFSSRGGLLKNPTTSNMWPTRSNMWPTTSNMWTRASGPTPTPDTGPKAAHDGTFYLFTEATSHNVEEFVLSVTQSLTANTDYELGFCYFMFGADMGTLSLEMAPTWADLHSSSWTNLWSKSGQQQLEQDSAWLCATNSIHPTVDSKLRIRALTGHGAHSDIAIDAVKLVASDSTELNNGESFEYETWGSAAMSVQPGSSTCTSCVAGTFSSNGEGHCTECPSGRYSASNGATNCVDCMAGKFATHGQSGCSDCASGRFAVLSASSSCDDCPEGRHVTSTGATNCVDCVAGRYSNTSGSIECVGCARGKISTTRGAASADACTDCPAGQYAAQSGTTECRDCMVGTFAEHPGTASCTGCVAGKFSSGLGQAAADTCIDCAAGYYSSTRGASFCDACAEGKYSTTAGAASATSCNTCASGEYSSAGSSNCTDWLKVSNHFCSQLFGPVYNTIEDAKEACSDGQYSLRCGSVYDDGCSGGAEGAGWRICADASVAELSVSSQGSCMYMRPTTSCSVDPKRCLESHPAAVCALPATEPDDDAAYRALLDAHDIQSRCDNCTCLAQLDLCEEQREAVSLLDSVCSTSCGMPRPTATRACATAALPSTAWQSTGVDDGDYNGGLPHMQSTRLQYDTPAEELPTVKQACEMGLEKLIRRTESWLELASEYQFQTVSSNAGVIATQLCLERKFKSLVCLQTGAKTHWLSLWSQLSQLQDQACNLANEIGGGYTLDGDLSSSDVPLLTFDRLQERIRKYEDYIQSLVNQKQGLETSRDLRELLAAEAQASAAGHTDEQNLLLTTIDAESKRMQVYRSQISDINSQIHAKLSLMELDGPKLLGTVGQQCEDLRAKFEVAIGSRAVPLRAEEHRALSISIGSLEEERAQTQQVLKETTDAQEQASLKVKLHRLEMRVTSAQQLIRDAPPQSDSTTTCDASCSTGELPVVSHCIHALKGKWAPFISIAAQQLSGCQSLDFLMNDAHSCCEAHDICYGSCGMTQAFCDKQLHDCIQAQASLPSSLPRCAALIDVTDFVAELLTDVGGCPAYTEAQALSVSSNCRIDGGGCRSLVDRVHHFGDAAIELADEIASKVGSYAGAIVSYHIPVISTAAAEVKKVADEAATVVHAVSKVWKTFWNWAGRRLQEATNCDGLDLQACAHLQSRISAIQAKLSAANDLVNSLAALSELNSKLLLPAVDEIDPVSLARIDMSFLNLDLLDDKALADMLGGAIGASAASYEAEMRQLVSLIRSKLEQMRAFMAAALSKHSHEQRRDFLSREAHRSDQLMHAELDGAEQLRVTARYFDTKIKVYSGMELHYVVHAAKAYEYQFLDRYEGISLDNLSRQKLSAEDMHDFVLKANLDLQDAHDEMLQSTTHSPQQSWAGTTVDLSKLPVAKNNLVQSGQFMVDLPLPANASNYHTTFSDVRVFLVAPSVESVIAVTTRKAGSSILLDERGIAHRFTTKQTDPPYGFQYDGSLDGECKHLSSTEWSDTYAMMSPYGSWMIGVDDAVLDLSTVTAVRFQFKLSYYQGKNSDTPTFFEDQPLALTDHERGELACHPPPDLCRSAHCGLHGFCSDSNTGVCVCDQGWSGEHCHVNCPRDCGTNGRCTGFQQCECDEGFFGEQCEHKDVCYDVYCAPNGGRCVADEETGQGTCRCNPGFVGRHCEITAPAGAVLPRMPWTSAGGGGGAGAVPLGAIVLVGIAFAARRKMTVVTATPELSTPLATAV